jgi:hypothetical protein
MTEEPNLAKQEFDAIAVVHGALAPLDAEARGRVLTYIASLLGIASHISVKGPAMGVDSDDESDEEPSSGVPREFADFAELFDAANPQTQSEMALVAAYWLQVSQRADSFTAQAATKELANMGHKQANITKSLTDLKNLRPALIMQLRKSGKSQQARKTYKVSVAGIRRVEEMING